MYMDAPSRSKPTAVKRRSSSLTGDTKSAAEFRKAEQYKTTRKYYDTAQRGFYNNPEIKAHNVGPTRQLPERVKQLRSQRLDPISNRIYEKYAGRLWNRAKAKGLYPTQKGMPRMVPGIQPEHGEQEYVGNDMPVGYRSVQYSPSIARTYAKGPAVVRGRQVRDRYPETTPLHEWTHTGQNTAAGPELMEGAAEIYGQRAANRLKMPYYRNPDYQTASKVAGLTGRQFIEKGQFNRSPKPASQMRRGIAGLRQFERAARTKAQKKRFGTTKLAPFGPRTPFPGMKAFPRG